MNNISPQCAQSKARGPQIIVIHYAAMTGVCRWQGWDWVERLKDEHGWLYAQSRDGSEVHLIHPISACWGSS